MTITTWNGCYNDNWNSLITPESISHPAKFSRGLITRIYRHALERGYIQPGATILDPFGGIGLGALDANANGLNWVGIELERNFVDMGSGCDCSGMSKDDYIRFYGRWRRVNGRHGCHWCPACINEAEQIKEPDGFGQLSLFGPGNSSSAAYIRNSGKIPYTQPHHYTGNLERFRRYAKSGTWAELVQEDSRNLSKFVRERFGGLVSSPPFGQSLYQADNGFYTDHQKAANGRNPNSASVKARSYGSSPGQLGTMPEGDIEAIITSPPFGQQQSGGGVVSGLTGDSDYQITKQGGMSGKWMGYHSQGNSPGQLAALPEGDIEAIITSPPFAGNSGGRGEASRQGIDAALFDRHSGGMVGGMGKEPGNLGNLRHGEVGAVISSPPYRDSVNQDQGANDAEARLARMRKAGIDTGQRQNVGGPNGVAKSPQRYGLTAGQLGAMPAGDVHGVISSPPFESSVGSDDPDRRGGLFRDPKRRNDTNLTGEYGQAEGQLGAEQGETFWTAAAQIVAECWTVLPPGGMAAWVVKDFVRNGEQVPFCDQWRQLCEFIGFEHLETIHASLIKAKAVQVSLEGNHHTIEKSHKSFFRRLAEKNGSPEINHETILIMRKS